MIQKAYAISPYGEILHVLISDHKLVFMTSRQSNLGGWTHINHYPSTRFVLVGKPLPASEFYILDDNEWWNKRGWQREGWAWMYTKSALRNSNEN